MDAKTREDIERRARDFSRIAYCDEERHLISCAHIAYREGATEQHEIAINEGIQIGLQRAAMIVMGKESMGKNTEIYAHIRRCIVQYKEDLEKEPSTSQETEEVNVKS